MAKLTEKEREGFEKILEEDLIAINTRFMNQIKDFWGIARKKVLEQKGWDKIIQEKERLLKERNEINERIHQIENTLNSEPLLAEQIVELGGKPDSYGRHQGAQFYGIPVTSQFEYDIVDYIRKYIDLEIPAKILRDVCSASIRALTMAGTFEEAREAYEKFYSLDFRKYGVDIPPRLDDIKKDKQLVSYARESLQQIENKEKPEIKVIEAKEDAKNA